MPHVLAQTLATIGNQAHIKFARTKPRRYNRRALLVVYVMHDGHVIS